MCIYVCEEIEQFLNPGQNVKGGTYMSYCNVTCMCDKFRQCVGQYLEVDLRVGNLIAAHKRHFQRTLLNLQYVRLAGESMVGRAFSSVTCVHAVSGNILAAIHYSADEKTAKKASRVRRQRVTAPVSARRPPAHRTTPRTNVSFAPLRPEHSTRLTASFHIRGRTSGVGAATTSHAELSRPAYIKY